MELGETTVAVVIVEDVEGGPLKKVKLAAGLTNELPWGRAW